MTDLSQHNGQKTSDPDLLEQDIARQREQLARTVDELGRKLDVKHRAEVRVHDTAAQVRDAVTTDSGKPRPDLLAAGAAVVAGIALFVWWRSHS